MYTVYQFLKTIVMTEVNFPHFCIYFAPGQACFFNVVFRYRYKQLNGYLVLRCSHPELESARKEIWEWPDEECRKGRRPRSVGQLLGKANVIPHDDFTVYKVT
jgi:hypothetical protein